MSGDRGPLATALRTAATLALLQAVLPVNAALTGAALLRGLVVPEQRATADEPRTVLVSGGKMTKALQLCRSFHRAGHRVVLVESEKYALTGHRFSRAVDAFHVVPEPQAQGYAEALLAVVRAEGVDVYVPVCSPVASLWDARAEALLAPECEVVHCSPEMIEQLDDKAAFAELCVSLGLGTPDAHRITAPEQVLEADLVAGADYVLKSIPYDPVGRLDLTPLPRPTPEQTLAFVASRGVSETRPAVLQQFVHGEEYCTHSTVRDGQVQLWACCRSSAFQINYEMVDKPAIRAWVEHFVGELGLTGQVSFDFLETTAGEVLAIECNPRTHSAITMFYDQPDVARAYLEKGVETVVPTATSRPTYWTYHEVWRLLTQPDRADRLRTIARGKDAVFDWADPLPFLALHHLSIPWLLLQDLRTGRDWKRIDFNIGKLVEPAGD